MENKKPILEQIDIFLEKIEQNFDPPSLDLLLEDILYNGIRFRDTFFTGYSGPIMVTGKGNEKLYYIYFKYKANSNYYLARYISTFKYIEYVRIPDMNILKSLIEFGQSKNSPGVEQILNYAFENLEKTRITRS